MGKIVFILLPVFLFSQVLQKYCNGCHQHQISYRLIYKRALLKYSSKSRILKNLSNFLISPNNSKSILPPPMQRRFNPSSHPKFSKEIAQKAIIELIEKEDIIKKFK